VAAFVATVVIQAVTRTWLPIATVIAIAMMLWGGFIIRTLPGFAPEAPATLQALADLVKASRYELR
jgi:flagellar biosynthesis protein FliQ